MGLMVVLGTLGACNGGSSPQRDAAADSGTGGAGTGGVADASGDGNGGATDHDAAANNDSDAPANSDGEEAGGGDASVAIDGSATCADGGTATVAFDDDFGAGLRPTLWTVSQTVAGLFGVDATQGDVRLAKAGTNTDGTVRSVAIVLNLAALGGPVTGDFEYTVDFSNAVIGPSGVDQVELHASFADNSFFFDVFDNSSGVNLHVWTGSINGTFATTVTGGTLRIARTGSTLSGYLGNQLIYSTTSTSPLSDVRFILQYQPGSNDGISVRYDNFHFQAGCAP
jgi:hypothetical protein